MMFLAFMNIGGQELILILLIVLVLFGAKKIPELARGMGQAIKEFQKAKDEFSDELHSARQDRGRRQAGRFDCPADREQSARRRATTDATRKRSSPAVRRKADAQRLGTREPVLG